MADDLEAPVKKLLLRVEKLEAELGLAYEQLGAAKREIARKDQIIAALQQRLFGSKSERYHPDQGQLDFGEEVLGKFEPSSSNPEGEEGAAGGRRAAGRERRNKRDLFPRCLRVEVVEEIVPEEVLADPESYVEIGELHHDELAVQKAELFWRRKIRKKFKARDDRDRAPLVAPAPPPSVPGTMCDPSLLAMVLTDKYVYHDPHYRQSARFLHRFGAELSRQTLNAWTHACVRHLEPLRAAIANELRLAEVIQVDETPMFYLLPGHGRTAQGYLWCYRDPATGTVAFDWRLGRGHESVVEFLGLDEETVECRVRLIQCDGYIAYETIAKRYREILLGACLTHIRRRFIEAGGESPGLTEAILARMRRLYAIEARMRAGPHTDACRMLIRSGHARPLLQELKDKIVAEHGRHLPKGKLGEALAYALGQWEQLERYLGDGRVDIDNNAVENLIRPAKLGLKNWLFIGSAEAGPASALLYTLVANCREQRIDPERYFEEALRRMPTDATPAQAAELTPAKLAPLIRELQPRPACRERPARDGATAAAA
jgi:transposase